MLEILIFVLFICGLLICLIGGFSILYALAAGLALFFLYGRIRKHGWRALAKMAGRGVWAVRRILLLLMLIGMMTALWRASGTIAFIVTYASRLIVPEIFLLMAFVLCGAVSLLIGTCFGAAATIGLICMTMGNYWGVPAWLTGGAILSGCYFGDRCSPMSSSALLVAELTGTDIYRNIRLMLRSAWPPFLAACGIYLLLGLILPAGNRADYALPPIAGFRLSWPTLVPALLIVLLSLLKLPVTETVPLSILAAALVAVFTQGLGWGELPGLLWYGYQAPPGSAAALLNGGGILSMLKVTAIVCLSSSYAGIFQETGLLSALKERVSALCRLLTPFGAMAILSLLTSMLLCNQTLATILTHQLSRDVVKDPYRMALSLENSAVVIAGLVPWSVASAVPLASVSAPSASIAAACYLYLLPVFTYAVMKRRPCPWGLAGEEPAA